MFTTASLDYKILPEILLIPLGSIIRFSDPKEIKRIKVLITKDPWITKESSGSLQLDEAIVPMV